MVGTEANFPFLPEKALMLPVLRDSEAHVSAPEELASPLLWWERR